MSDRLTDLLDELTRLVRLWEQRAEADNAPRCGSPTWVEQKAWARARSNDALELARLVAEYRAPSAEESSAAKHKAWKGW